MAITANATTLTFNNGSTQTVAPVNTNANVNSVSAGTGISVSATTGALTVTNAGVTSVTAGSGISVSASTGGVTISTSGGGGVTSLNGQTGAITNTTFDTIGSYAAAVYAVNGAGSINVQTASISQNATVAGSSLRYSYNSGGGGAFVESNASNTGGIPTGYNQGGTALSGTWRSMGRGAGSLVRQNCDTYSTYWYPGLFVRIS